MAALPCPFSCYPAPSPGAIYGPPLAAHHVDGSVTIVHDLMMGKFPMIPKLDFAGVDVRDVAAAHIKAMEAEGVQGGQERLALVFGSSLTH